MPPKIAVLSLAIGPDPRIVTGEASYASPALSSTTGSSSSSAYWLRSARTSRSRNAIAMPSLTNSDSVMLAAWLKA